MPDQKYDIDILLSDTGDYLETQASLWKLKTVDTLSDSVSDIAAGLGIISIAGIFALIMSIGLALLIGDWLGKDFYGFFIIGGMYGIVGLVCYAKRGKWFKEPVGNMLVKKLLKHKK
jgi:hypothetical protein